MNPEDSEKQSFYVYINNITKDKLKSKICIPDMGQGDYRISPEFQWIVTECVKCSSLQAQDLGDCLGLSPDDVGKVIHNAPREREDQVAGTIVVWSKMDYYNATIESFLEALHFGDKTELMEAICEGN